MDKLKRKLLEWAKEKDAEFKNSEVFYFPVYKKPLQKLHFDVHIVDHCNLNCKGCNHFAPLAKEKFLDIKSFESDLRRVEQIFSQDGVDYILLMGGEPLLHPEIEKFITLSREIFKTTRIDLVTNGILLGKAAGGENLYEVLGKNNVGLSVTPYPIKINLDEIEKQCTKHNVRLEYRIDRDSDKQMRCIPLDIKGEQNPKRSFAYCKRGNFYIMLDKGRLYTCSAVAKIDKFNEYFNQNLKIEEEDYVDIYKENSKEVILKKLSRPIPFCKYCNVDKHTENLPWDNSKCDINEWVQKDKKYTSAKLVEGGMFYKFYKFILNKIEYERDYFT